jgi:hypothetical protein
MIVGIERHRTPSSGIEVTENCDKMRSQSEPTRFESNQERLRFFFSAIFVSFCSRERAC